MSMTGYTFVTNLHDEHLGHQVRAEEELAPAGLHLRGRLLPLHLPPLSALQVAGSRK